MSKQNSELNRTLAIKNQIIQLFDGRLTMEMLQKMDLETADWLLRTLYVEARVVADPELLDVITEAALADFSWDTIRIVYMTAITSKLTEPKKVNPAEQLQRVVEKARQFHYANERQRPVPDSQPRPNHDNRGPTHGNGNGAKKQLWHQKVYQDGSDRERELFDWIKVIQTQTTKTVHLIQTRGPDLNANELFDVEKLEQKIQLFADRFSSYLDTVLKRPKETTE
jgi:hypothetical protein